jgi:hypothetical protein
LFTTGSTTPAAAGVCDVACNPLTENNLLGGPGANCRCGSGTACYGYPSFGTPPVTSFTCNNVLAGSETLVHRSQLTGTIFINSCAPGYLPLLRESTMVATAVCVAMCGPRNCYAGNCGTNDENRLGASPHRCNTTDARGMFNTAPDGEACRYIWSFEIDDQGTFLRSPTSDTLGFCFDHSKYQYDSNGDNMPDMNLPTCQQLQDGFGSGTDPSMPNTYFGAADLGCVDTTHAGLPFQGKTSVIVHKPRGLDGFRPLY